jgi:dolichyl-phosphate-mannose--protein O-mannosyl transferase
MFSSFLPILVLALGGFAVAAYEVDGHRHITCGSALKLRHLNSSKYFLKSAEAKYSSGGQQVVTCGVDGDLLWQVRDFIYYELAPFILRPSQIFACSCLLTKIREAHNATTCVIGEPIRCGDVIRLTHVKTNKNLHSHGIAAPLTRHNFEVSGFGDGGRGDVGDNWRVECLRRKGAEAESSSLWRSDSLVRFNHVETERWLSSFTKTKFHQSNCPNCPILGDLEVVAAQGKSDAVFHGSIFRADDGVYLRL